jgi:adenine-specific DNA-methyltransferase
MPRRRPKTKTGPEVEDYRHEDKRTNNPPAGIMGDYGPKSEPTRRKYEYNPHLDPQLVGAGKAEHTSFEVENVRLYIYERISTQAILRAVKRGDVNPTSR